jgi:uncharacterized protein YuzE
MATWAGQHDHQFGGGRMQVTLSCAADQVTISFGEAISGLRESPVSGLSGAWLVLDDVGGLSGVRITRIDALCPYELRKVIRRSVGSEVRAELQSTFDASCDMGYIYLDKRGSASVASIVGSMDSGVLVDIGKDGVILGFEILAPSRLLPALANG